MDLAALESCAALTAEDADTAARSRDGMTKLLARITQIARPETGCAKLLMVLARLARGDLTWVDGEIAIELAGGDRTTLSVWCDAGFGLLEQLFPTTELDVPLDEFLRAVKLAPKLIAPLRAREEGGKLLLSTSQAPNGAAAPTAFELDDPGADHAGSPAPPGAQVTARPPPPPPNVHTRPTVRRMVAVDPALFRKPSDPRRDED